MNSFTLALPSSGLPAAASSGAKFAPLLPRTRISVRTAIWSFLLGIGLICPFTIFAAFFPISSAVQQRLEALPLHPGLFFLTSMLLGPVIEELIYRGLFLQLTRRYLPLWLAIAIPSVVFAATHIIPAGWAYLGAFPLSCILSWLMVRSGSLYSSLLCHCTFNAVSGFALIPAFDLTAKTLGRAAGTAFNPLTGLFPFWWTALSTALIVAAFAMISRDNPVRQKPAAIGA